VANSEYTEEKEALKQAGSSSSSSSVVSKDATGAVWDGDLDCAWLLAGLVIGFLSPMTGTGGPLIAVPLMLLWAPEGISMRQIVALAVVGTLPCSVVSTIFASLEETVDLGASLAVAGVMCLGVPIGKALAERMTVEWLKLVISLALLAIGANILREMG